jgi:hypothetical protein
MRSPFGVLLMALAAAACAREAPARVPYYYAPAPWYAYPAAPYGWQAAPPPANANTPPPSAPLAPAAAVPQNAAPPSDPPPTPSTPPPPPPAWYAPSEVKMALTIPGGDPCLAQLAAQNVRYQRLGATRGVDTPVATRSPLGGVKWSIAGGAPLVADCRLVVALTKIAPELTALGISEMIYSSAYSYRFTRQGRLSLHARGLAVDVHEVVVSGQRESVRRDFARGRGDGCAPTNPLLNRLACRLRALGLFRELITPDHDADHQDHLHLGIAPLPNASPPPPPDEPNFELSDLGEPGLLR